MRYHQRRPILPRNETAFLVQFSSFPFYRSLLSCREQASLRLSSRETQTNTHRRERTEQKMELLEDRLSLRFSQSAK